MIGGAVVAMRTEAFRFETGMSTIASTAVRRNKRPSPRPVRRPKLECGTVMTIRRATVAGLLVTWLVLLGSQAAIAETDVDIANLPDLGSTLGALAIVVLVVESGLTTIFQWRVYRMVFNSRAMKTVVMFAVGLTIVLAFNYDVFADLMALTLPDTTPANWSGPVSAVLSALIIAGGSSGVNTLLQRLGFRNPIGAKEKPPELDNTQAWISVRVNRVSAVGPVQIAVKESANASEKLPLAGTVEESKIGQRLKAAFSADAMRFPNYGGRTMTVGKCYEIVAIGEREVSRAEGVKREPLVETVYKGSFAPRAIVDFVVDM